MKHLAYSYNFDDDMPRKHKRRMNREKDNIFVLYSEYIYRKTLRDKLRLYAYERA